MPNTAEYPVKRSAARFVGYARKRAIRSPIIVVCPRRARVVCSVSLGSRLARCWLVAREKVEQPSVARTPPRAAPLTQARDLTGRAYTRFSLRNADFRVRYVDFRALVTYGGPRLCNRPIIYYSPILTATTVRHTIRHARRRRKSTNQTRGATHQSTVRGPLQLLTSSLRWAGG